MKPKRVIFGRGEGKSSHVIEEMLLRYLFYTTIPHKNYNRAMEMRLNGFFRLKGENRDYSG